VDPLGWRRVGAVAGAVAWCMGEDGESLDAPGPGVRDVESFEGCSR
jgi:hypothetical protein